MTNDRRCSIVYHILNPVEELTVKLNFINQLRDFHPDEIEENYYIFTKNNILMKKNKLKN